MFAGGQDGTPEDDIPYWMAMAGDGSVICVGQTYGSWGGNANGDSDFAAFRLDGNGEEIWRYQVGFSPKRESWLIVRINIHARPASPITDRRFFRSSTAISLGRKGVT